MPWIVTLHVEEHCVETAARREFKRLLDEFFTAAGGPDPALEEKIAILREFIEESDFAALRASDARLSGLSKSTVRLYRRVDGSVRMSIL